MSLNVNSGEIVGLLGPNSAGKTTFYGGRYCRRDAGSITIDDEDITLLPLHERARKIVGCCHKASIFRRLSVYDNIMGILEIRHVNGRTTKRSCRRAT